MIAPLRPSQVRAAETRRRLRWAHQYIATTLLSPSAPTAPRIAPWKAWLFVAWLIVSVVAYAGSMLAMW